MVNKRNTKIDNILKNNMIENKINEIGRKIAELNKLYGELTTLVIIEKEKNNGKEK